MGIYEYGCGDQAGLLTTLTGSDVTEEKCRDECVALDGCRAVVTNMREEGDAEFECKLHRGCGSLYLDQNQMIFGKYSKR